MDGNIIGKSMSTSYLQKRDSNANEFRSATVHKTRRISKNSMTWVLLSEDVPSFDAVGSQNLMSRKWVRRDFLSSALLAWDSCLSKNPYFISIQRGMIGIRPICELQSLRKNDFRAIID
jgi:hypothetical protein